MDIDVASIVTMGAVLIVLGICVFLLCISFGDPV